MTQFPVLAVILHLMAGGVWAAPRGRDASTTVGEDSWYWARDDWFYLSQHCRDWDRKGKCRHLMCVDVFSVSQGFRKIFEKNGHSARSFDVKTSPQEDITTKAGFLVLLDMGLATVDGAFIPLAPPCSLFVGISAACHRRSVKNLLGDVRRHCVRLSNVILANMVTFLLLMRYFRPGAFVMIEQPSSSWLFKQVCFQEVIRRFHLKKHLTHLGLWGHDLLKATHLMTNIPSLKAIETKVTADMKQKHRKRVARKRAAAKAAGKPVRCYYKQLPGGRFQGGPDLSSSAVYPQRFIAAVYKCWLDRCTFWV